jgi:GTPase SAR1 family protein
MSKRKFIAIGKTGVGKSFILSRILSNKDEIFKYSSLIDSCTGKIESAQRTLNRDDFRDPKDLGSNVDFDFEAYDTPGLADSQGRTHQFLDEIMKTLRETQFNQILIFIEYGKFSSDIQRSLEALNCCLICSSNGENNSAFISLIINKVPTDKSFVKDHQNPAVKGEEIEKIVKGVGKLINIDVSSYVKIEKLSEEDDDETENFKKSIDQLRKLIAKSNDHFKSNGVKTWSELVDAKQKEIAVVTAERDYWAGEMCKIKAERQKFHEEIASGRNSEYPLFFGSRDPAFICHQVQYNNISCSMENNENKFLQLNIELEKLQSLLA